MSLGKRLKAAFCESSSCYEQIRPIFIRVLFIAGLRRRKLEYFLRRAKAGDDARNWCVLILAFSRKIVTAWKRELDLMR